MTVSPTLPVPFPSPPASQARRSHAFFLLAADADADAAAAALALAAFFLLLRIMTTLRKEPTTAEPSSSRITGMRTAQTRGGKKFCSG